MEIDKSLECPRCQQTQGILRRSDEYSECPTCSFTAKTSFFEEAADQSNVSIFGTFPQRLLDGTDSGKTEHLAREVFSAFAKSKGIGSFDAMFRRPALSRDFDYQLGMSHMDEADQKEVFNAFASEGFMTAIQWLGSTIGQLFVKQLYRDLELNELGDSVLPRLIVDEHDNPVVRQTVSMVKNLYLPTEDKQFKSQTLQRKDEIDRAVKKARQESIPEGSYLPVEITLSSEYSNGGEKEHKMATYVLSDIKDAPSIADRRKAEAEE